MKSIMNNPHFPLVSIVLATYNGEKYLGEQIDSLLLQTYPNLEIIAVDDNSTDGTVAILEQYSRQHPHIKVYENETNLGFIKNFEKGCSLTTGEFIAPCDQDDYWLPDKIKRKMEAIGNHSMIYCDSDICDENLQRSGKKISDLVVCRNFYSCLEYAVFARIYGHALLFTRSLFIQASPFIKVIPHDWWLAFNATIHNGFAFLPESHILYRQHASNVFGVVNRSKVMGKNKEEKKKTDEEKLKLTMPKNEAIRKRMDIFYNQCPASLTYEKNVLYKLNKSYQSFSFSNNWLRMVIFFQNYKLLLATKKRSLLRKYLFCCKMFTKIT